VRRLVYLSSASVHGQAPPAGTDEDSPLSDRQAIAYNNSKVRAERTLERLRGTGPVEIVRLRPGIVYGPRSSWRGGFADELLAGRAYLVNGGEGICNALYVDNLVHAIHLAATTPGVDGQVFLLGDRETITWREFYRPIVEALGMDLDALPCVSPRGIGREPGDPRRWPGLRRGVAALPRPVRDALYSVHASWTAPRPPSPWSPPAPAELRVTTEMALLHRCRVKLESARASSVLGYEPPLSFTEACARSVAWLAFCGYPVVTRA
jgi:2-alkyl-3-oxoalkanoate reductase